MDKLKPSFFSFWVENYKTSFLLLFLIIVIGITSMITIPKESSPDIKFGIISISTIYSGVNPQDIDNLITDKIEKEIKDLEGISKITSSSSVGVSSVTVELNNGVNTRDILTDIKDKVGKLALPSDAKDPLIQEISTKNELLFQALLYGSREKYNDFQLMSLARQMQDDLAGTSGIESIDIGASAAGQLGASSTSGSYEIKVLLSKAKIENLNLNVNSIASTIRSFNKNTPLGNFTIGDLNYDFRFDGEINTIQQLGNIIISGKGISSIRLADVAEITTKYKDDSIKSLGFHEKSGYNYASLSVNKKAGDNIFQVSASAKKALEEYIKNTPGFSDLHIKYSQDLGANIVKDYQNLGGNAIQTVILVFLTILIFVGFRESLIASILLPLSFLLTFTTLSLLGLSLNFLTNFSLVLTLGIAIDTIIVIVEGAAERQKMGFTRKSAAILAVQELKAPLISGTATTLVAFLPMIFLPGIIGKFLSYIPITVFSTLVAALILSLTLASALFYKLAAKKKEYHENKDLEQSFSQEERDFLEEERKGKINAQERELSRREKFLEFLSDKYSQTLSILINSKKSRVITMFLPLILLIVSFIFISPKIGFTLFPATDEGIININIEAKTGTNETSLKKHIPEIEDIISQYPELNVYYINLSKNIISVYIELIDVKQRESKGMKDVFAVEDEILTGLTPLQSEGLKVEIATQSNGPPAGAPVGVKLNAISSNDINTLKSVADDFKRYLQSLPGTKNISTSSSDNPGQFVYRFDTNKLAFSGLTPDDIVNSLRTYIAGTNAGTLKSIYEDNDIVLSIGEFENDLNPEDINDLIIDTRIGPVRVGDYANFTFEPALSSITRLDGKINISVDSELENGVLPTDIQPKLLEFARNYNYPQGISYLEGGENSDNADLIFATVQSFFISIFLIFMILVFQFNSYSQPLMILYTVVLATLGVNIGLYVTGNPYSMPFGIGFIALTGIVVNDAIILIDRINSNLDRLNLSFVPGTLKKEDYVKSLIAAGKARLQPIIVTTLTTVFGILPLALQDPFWAGLGFTIIFGLSAGSAMTLFVIPSLYYSTYLNKKIREGLPKIED